MKSNALHALTSLGGDETMRVFGKGMGRRGEGDQRRQLPTLHFPAKAV